jgi:hypothetical protein
MRDWNIAVGLGTTYPSWIGTVQVSYVASEGIQLFEQFAEAENPLKVHVLRSKVRVASKRQNSFQQAVFRASALGCTGT